MWGIGSPSVDDVCDSRAIVWVSLFRLPPLWRMGKLKNEFSFVSPKIGGFAGDRLGIGSVRVVQVFR